MPRFFQGEEETGKSLGQDRNPMKGFKTSESRLARLFKNSREQWKERAAAKQKKLRTLEVKVRDLSDSARPLEGEGFEGGTTAASTSKRTRRPKKKRKSQELNEVSSLSEQPTGEEQEEKARLTPKGHN